MADKRLGQNFLCNEDILEFEASLVEISGKRVIEIGAGDGRLSKKLVLKNPSRLVLIEKDRNLARVLESEFKNMSNVSILNCDALEVDFSRFDVVFGNIPYSISSPLLFLLARQQINRAVLCLQKEFALRLVAKPGTKEYGRLSVTAGHCFNSRIMRIVPAEAFRPKPKVDSAIVMLERRGEALGDEESDFIRKIFSYKKQKVKNAIKHAFQTLGSSVLEMLPHKDRKVYTLNIEEIRDVFWSLKAYGKTD
ncbi:MAG: 16S rRNA (adenine(1518)-N(6)/adenine(1519)-N(6))-dimethyltransferase RsmA [Candidatus Anstonellales archaeon]